MMADLMRALKQLCLIALGGFLIWILYLTWSTPTRFWSAHKGKQARVSATKIEMSGNIKTALGQFEVNVGRFPTTAEGLKALVECPPTAPAKSWQDPYMETIPRDAWGTEFRYVFPSTRPGLDFELTSAGPDRRFGTRDDLANYPIDFGPMPPLSEWEKYPGAVAFKYAIVSFETLCLALVARALFKKELWAVEEIG